MEDKFMKNFCELNHFLTFTVNNRRAAETLINLHILT